MEDKTSKDKTSEEQEALQKEETLSNETASENTLSDVSKGSENSEDSGKKSSEKKKKGSSSGSRTTLIVVIIVSVVVIALLIFLVWYLWQRAGNEIKDNTSGKGYLIEDNDDVDDFPEEEKNEEEFYTIEQISRWTLSAATGISTDSYVRNNEVNLHPVWFDIRMRNEDITQEGELLYTSPILKVGQSMTNVTFDKKLAPGQYSAILSYHIIDENNDNAELSVVSTGLSLSVHE